MTIQDQFTSKDMIESFERIFDKMNIRYDSLVRDINLALGKLNDTTEELKKARDYYQKGYKGALLRFFDNHGKALGITTIIALAVVAVVFLMTKDLSYKNNEIQIETKTNKITN